MNIREQDLAAISDLGYTPEEARFLYVVATHSGYFQPRQYLTARGGEWGGRVQRLTEKIESRGHATWREYLGTGGVYHLLSKTIYRRIEKTDLRNRRRHSAEFIRTRLLLLDFILENAGYEYLETEADKLAYFCDLRGLPRDVLPAKVYQSTSGAPPTRRYFVDKYPLFLGSSAGGSPVVSLSFVDPGQSSLTGFAHHLQQYASLLSWIGDFRFVYIADSAENFRKAEECFDLMVRKRVGPEAIQDVVRFFERRRAWELKQYSQFSPEDVERLQSAGERYAGPEIEKLYSAWVSNELKTDGLHRALAQKYATANISFRGYLVGRTGSPLPVQTSATTSASTSDCRSSEPQQFHRDEN